MHAIQYLSGDRTPILRPQFESLNGSIVTADKVKSALDKSNDEELQEIVCKWIFVQEEAIA
jgi:ABC-type iron transport system FetAB ATPase subunit